jgi:hypothetical protein
MCVTQMGINSRVFVRNTACVTTDVLVISPFPFKTPFWDVKCEAARRQEGVVEGNSEEDWRGKEDIMPSSRYQLTSKSPTLSISIVFFFVAITIHKPGMSLHYTEFRLRAIHLSKIACERSGLNLLFRVARYVIVDSQPTLSLVPGRPSWLEQDDEGSCLDNLSRKCRPQ